MTQAADRSSVSPTAAELRIRDLERRLSRLQRVLAVGAVVLGAVVLTGMNAPGGEPNSQEVLHARGLVIEDSYGRPRIVLGAPIGDLEGRLRKDSTVGLLVLGEDGMDRVSVGSPTIAPQVMGQVRRRIDASSGMVINDAKGNERSGYGYLDNGTVALGLDHEDGEGVMLFIGPQGGHQGVLVNGPAGDGDRQRIFLGTTLDANSAGAGVLVLNNEDASRHTMIHGNGREALPSILVHRAGEVAADLVEQAVEDKK